MKPKSVDLSNISFRDFDIHITATVDTIESSIFFSPKILPRIGLGQVEFVFVIANQLRPVKRLCVKW